MSRKATEFQKKEMSKMFRGFANKDKLCAPFKKRVHDPSAPYDAYDETDDTEEGAKAGFLKGVGR